MKHLTMALLAALTLPVVARADDLCPLVADLNGVVAAETGYTTPPCPDIGFADLPSGTELRSQAGAYYPDTGRIELTPDLDLTTAYGQSYLLHELVHAAQYASGAEARAACPAALEAEAYGVQARFLIAKGDRDGALTLFVLGTQLGNCGAGYEH